MKRTGSLVLRSLVFLAIASFTFVNAQAQKAPQPMAQVGGNSSTHNSPQVFVVCTGWHALCTASPNCQMNPAKDKADCDCMRVNETHVVATDSIQDPAVKRLTLIRCTTEHRCDVDEAPVCNAIKYGQYEVDGVKYDWVSTYSYRGWCSLLKPPPRDCNTGDLHWAFCDAAPCTEIQNPSNPDQPLSCQCQVVNSQFVGLNGSCTGENGAIISSSPDETWDFEKNTYKFPIPGLEYVNGACAQLGSDPLPQGIGGPGGP
jgi:hypothetical protein